MSSYIYIFVFDVLILGAFGYPGNLNKDENPEATTKQTANKDPTKQPKPTTPRKPAPLTQWDLPFEPPPIYRPDTIVYETTKATTPLDEEEMKKRREKRLQMRRNQHLACKTQKHIRIQDEYGCEMCTCLHKKSSMLCFPFKCADREEDRPLRGIQDNLYNDYVINVPSHFSEYKCEVGDVVAKNPLCECECVMKDILSCPSYCRLGTPLER